MRNKIPNYNFGECLKYLYSINDVNTSKRGWAAPIVSDMFDKGILIYNSTDNVKNADARIKQKYSVKKSLQNHLNRSSVEEISGHWLTVYCEYFDCSADYLMGYIEKPNYSDTDIYKETGLNEKSIQALREIQKHDKDANSITLFPPNLYKKNMTKDELEEFEKIFFNTPKEYIHLCPNGHPMLMDLLNFILGENLGMERILMAFSNLVNPYTVPVFFDNERGWIYPDNEFSKCMHYGGGSTYTINLASDENKPNDNIPIFVNDDFIDSVNLKSIENIFRSLLNEYKNQK